MKNFKQICLLFKNLNIKLQLQDCGRRIRNQDREIIKMLGKKSLPNLEKQYLVILKKTLPKLMLEIIVASKCLTKIMTDQNKIKISPKLIYKKIQIMIKRK